MKNVIILLTLVMVLFSATLAVAGPSSDVDTDIRVSSNYQNNTNYHNVVDNRFAAENNQFAVENNKFAAKNNKFAPQNNRFSQNNVNKFGVVDHGRKNRGNTHIYNQNSGSNCGTVRIGTITID